MLIGLGIMAGSIFLLYSVYFISIIRGNPADLEMHMQKSLADWIIRKKAAAKIHIWLMYAGSVLIEALYFYLALICIHNPVMDVLTGAFILFEIFHLLTIGNNLRRFFKGEYLLSQIFPWGRERASAVFFFTHAFMIISILAAFS